MTRPAASPADSLSVAAAAAHASEVFPGVPVYPGAASADTLRRSMRAAWEERGEPAALFEARLGEAILWTDDAWEDVRAFYRARAARILMDHEMEFPEGAPQKMLTGLIQAADGSIVKFTVTRPFFRYPDRERIDRTVIQMGRLVPAGTDVPAILPADVGETHGGAHDQGPPPGGSGSHTH